MWDRHDERLERLPAFGAKVDRRRQQAFVAHPSSVGQLADLSFEEIQALEESGYADNRPRQWPEPLNAPKRAGFGNYAARAYRRGLTLDAGEFFGATAAATVMHELVVRGGYRPMIPPALRDGPAPTGPTASAIVGYFEGKPTGRRTWQLWRRSVFRVEDDIL